MSGNRKKGKGKGSEKDQGDKSAFAVDLSKEKGKTIYIPGSFWGLKDADAEKQRSSGILIIILILIRVAFSAVAQIATHATRATRIGMHRNKNLAVKKTVKYSGGMKLFSAETVVIGTIHTSNTGNMLVCLRLEML